MEMTIPQAIQHAVQLHQSGDLPGAESIYRQVLAVQPENADALHLLGVLVAQAGQSDAGAQLIRRAIQNNPRGFGYYVNLAQVLIGSKQLNEAVAVLRQAIAIAPNFFKAHILLGNTLQSLDQIPDAVAAFRDASAVFPDSPELHNNLGNALLLRGNVDEAIAEIRRSIQLKADLPESHFNLGVALHSAGRSNEALEAIGRAIQLRPGAAENHAGLGNVLRDMNQLDDAMHAYDQAIQLRADHVDALNGRGIVLYRLGRFSEAGEMFRAAMQSNPSSAMAHFNLSQVLLIAGDYSDGWREYEYRVQQHRHRFYFRDLSKPQWLGEPIAGKRILLRGEQGFGDALQFIRFAKNVAELGADVIVATQPELIRLIRTSPGVSRVIRHEEIDQTEFDLHASLLSLPLRFDVNADLFPANVPYVFPDSADVEKWKSRLATLPGRMKVGLAWRGRSLPDPRRSIAARAIAPLMDLADVAWISLQKPTDQDEPEEHPGGLTDFTAELTDFAETAALMKSLDLIITIDSAVAHLAGALGKPTWTLLPFAPDWRWRLDRSDCPWYPTMTLFRQKTIGDWSWPIGEVIKKLRERV
jgi:tetratricopeptide (TPR) repeat protein